MEKVETRLNCYFAMTACLCGLTFLGSPELGSWPLVAVFFALFGLVFVDLLKWFALPTTMAYLSLGAIAFYTINSFFAIGDFSPEPQMVTVAELLILVQSVLMLQRKNRRIYEQLAVFALLQLIVAAIFNNAVSYGLLLLPLGATVIGALSLLHICSTAEDAFGEAKTSGPGLRVHSPDSQRSFAQAGGLFPRTGLLTVVPSVLVVAFVFFYALPRTNQQARHGLGGKAQVGFSSEVRLGQIGQMMLIPDIAARIDVNDRRTGAPYNIVGDLYVRGAVLEKYNVGGNVDGTWGTADGGRVMAPRQMPPAPQTRRAVNRLANDDVRVKINVSPMKGQALFSIPPYFFDSSGPEIVHQIDRWVISRRVRPIMNRNSQISYRFGSHAFRNGIQSPFSPRFWEQERTVLEPTGGAADESQQADGFTRQGEEEMAYQEMLIKDEERSANKYVQSCLDYDIDRVPSAVRAAQTALGRMAKYRDNPAEVARQMERYLATSGDYRYTLNLTMEPIVGIDPIEQFLTVDRSGNCQYFASALVLMLRSQGIPARLVVGFNTDEFNTVGGYFVARQLHAHAWVEALVDAKWLNPNELHYSSSPVDQYWMRLDPTPGGGGSTQSAAGRVSNVLDLAQDMWTSYVVDADASDRRRELGIGSEGMSGTYQRYYEWMKLKVSRVRAGELGAGALADGTLFSWPTALAVIVILLFTRAAYQLLLPRWMLRNRGNEKANDEVLTPTIPFFAETVSLLETVGMRRRRGQTPKEFTSSAANQLADGEQASLAGPLSELTTAFYVERFGMVSPSEGGEASVTREHRIKLALSRLRELVTELTMSRGRDGDKKS